MDIDFFRFIGYFYYVFYITIQFSVINIKIINSNNSIKPTKLVPLKQSEFVWNNDTNIDNDNKIQKTKIIDYLNSDGVYVDEIIRISRMSASEVALELLNLEMNGMIERQSGNKVALIKRK